MSNNFNEKSTVDSPATWRARRCVELVNGMNDNLDSGKLIPADWVRELRDHLLNGDVLPAEIFDCARIPVASMELVRLGGSGEGVRDGV